MPAVAIVEQERHGMADRWSPQGSIFKKRIRRDRLLSLVGAHAKQEAGMALDTDKIDDTALALLYLTLHDGVRAWKGMDWGVLDRLHDKGMICDPVGKVKSVVFTEEGLERAKALFEAMFEK
jgi:hypothetical protein